jgi:hypothetical protein
MYETEKMLSFEPDLNQRPMDFNCLQLQSTALPTELSKVVHFLLSLLYMGRGVLETSTLSRIHGHSFVYVFKGLSWDYGFERLNNLF